MNPKAVKPYPKTTKIKADKSQRFAPNRPMFNKQQARDRKRVKAIRKSKNMKQN